MDHNSIINGLTREFGPVGLSINVHADGTQSIYVPQVDGYFTSTDPQALWKVIRGCVRRNRPASAADKLNGRG